MAAATNIPVSATTTEFVAAMRQAAQSVVSLRNGAQAAFAGIRQSVDAPAGSFTALTRLVNQTARQMRDLLAVGAPVPAELSARYATLRQAVESVNGAFARQQPPLAPYEALKAKIEAVRREMLDLGASGNAVPAELSSRFNSLRTQLAAVERATQRQQTAMQRLAGVGQGLQSVGQSLSTYLTAPLLLAGGAAYKTFADIDALKRGLINIEGTAEKAEARFVMLREVARLPGLGLEEAVKGDVRLRAVGFAAEQSRQILLQFGNALALTGGGKFELDSVITQITQMGSKSRVLAEDLKPILNASPAVAKAIKDMFGTVDSETISKSLQAAGKGPQDFIAALVTKLSELERVSGGPKNAIENFGDSLKIASYEFGKAADRSLGLTSKLNALGDFVGKLATGFGSLGPTTQSLILGMGGIAVAVGPVLLGIGSLARLAPTLVQGFNLVRGAFSGLSVIGPLLAGVSAPVLGIAAAVGVTAGLIIFYWDDIKKKLLETGIWQAAATAAEEGMSLMKRGISGLALLFQKAWGEIKEVTTAAIEFLRAAWGQFGPDLVAVAKGAFGSLTAIVRGAFEVVGGIFQTIGGVLSGDWSKALDGLRRITTAVFTGIVRLVAAQVQIITGLAAGLFDAIGADGVASKLRSWGDVARQNADRLTQSLQTTKKTANDTASALKNIPAGGAPTKTTPPAPKAPPATATTNFNITAPDAGIKALRDELKRAKAEVESIAATKGIDAVPADKIARVKELQARIKEIGRLTKTTALPKEVVETYKQPADELEFWGQMIKRIEGQIKSLRQNGQIIDPQVFANLDAAKAKVEELEEVKKLLQNPVTIPVTVKVDALGNVETSDKLPPIDGIERNLQNGFDKRKVGLPGEINRIQTNTDGSPKSSVPNMPFVEQIALLKAQIPLFNKGMEDAARSVSERSAMLQEAFLRGREQLRGDSVNLLAGIGESIGKGENPLKAALQRVLDMVGGYLIQLGTALLLSSSALLAAAPFTFGLTIQQGVGQQIAGAGLIVGGGLVKGLAATPFASGGLVSGPVLGLVGEGPGTNLSNPEVIAPLDKLKSLLPSGGGATRVEVVGRISGSDILLSTARAKAAQNDQYGR